MNFTLHASPSPAVSEPTPLLTVTEVARWLGVSPKRVYELPLPRVQVSVRCVRWRRVDVEAWLAERTKAA